MKWGKGILLFIFAFVILVGVVSPVYALNPDEGYAICLKYPEVCSGFHVSNVNTNNYSDFIRRAVGPVPGITVTEDESPNSGYSKQMLGQSAVYNVNKYISYIFTSPPASTYAFIQDIGQTLGFMPKPAYAQGVGFSGLSALLSVWKVFRNMAYFILAIVMVVIGFMVMFRKKIDPKTVVTVQNALPRIILALLLITFSYAIVGLSIDIMYLLIALVGSVFQHADLLPDATTATILNGELWGSSFASTSPLGVDLFGRIFLGTTDPTIVSNAVAIPIIGAILSVTPLGPAVGVPVMIIGGMPIIIGVLISLGVLFLVIRLFFYFLGAYIKIITSLLFSPFQLLMVAIPGSQSFESWLKNLIANILVFPSAAVMFFIANVFMSLSNSNDPLWSPPYAHLFVNNATSVGTLVSLGILFSIPTVGKAIQEALKVKPSGIGGLESVGGVFTAPTQLGMQIYQFITSHETMKAFKNQGKGDKTPHA